jgi:hypothetical protein
MKGTLTAHQKLLLLFFSSVMVATNDAPVLARGHWINDHSHKTYSTGAQDGQTS